VRIRTRDGRLHEVDHPHQLGAPDNPMSADDVRAKFRENAGLAHSEETAEALERDVLALERQDDVRGALAPLGVEKVAV
jgi:hypothetical protein